MKSRRDFCLGAAITLGLGGLAQAQAEPPPEAPSEPTLKSRFLFSMEAALESPQSIGDRQIFIAKSGIVEGPRIRGTLLAGGGDWSKKRADGSTMLDVRGTFKTDDDQLVYCWYNGIIAKGEKGMYFRTTPYFETASEKYAWLNNIVAVGVFKPVLGKVAYNVFEIL